MDLSFGREHRLKSKKLITRIFSEGKSFKAYPLVAVVLHLEAGVPLKAGFSVPKKKIPGAADRNLIKRRMRESLRQTLGEFGTETYSGLAFMLIYVDRKVPDYQQIDDSVRRILKKLKESIKPDVEQH